VSGLWERGDVWRRDGVSGRIGGGTGRGDGAALAGGRSGGRWDSWFGRPGAGHEQAKALCVSGATYGSGDVLSDDGLSGGHGAATRREGR
jgi:hypothetical protein